MTTLAILRAVRARIADPSRWMSGAWARDERGRDCPPCSIRAYAWSVYGAIRLEAMAATGVDWSDEYSTAAHAVEDAIGGGSVAVSQWERMPGRTHADVLALIDRTVAGLEVSQ